MMAYLPVKAFVLVIMFGITTITMAQNSGSVEDFTSFAPSAAPARNISTYQTEHFPREVSAPPGQPGSLGGISEKTGYFLCADYDEKTNQCRVRELSAEQREHAMQTGLDVVKSMSLYKNEAVVRSGKLAQGYSKNTAISSKSKNNGDIENLDISASQNSKLNCFEKKLLSFNKTHSNSITPQEMTEMLGTCND